MSGQDGRSSVTISDDTPGRVVEIQIAIGRGQVTTPVSEVLAVAGRGLDGDRYYYGRGSFSRWPGGGRAVSFMAVEAIEAILREHRIDLFSGRSRRNIATQGISLQQLVGKQFRIGEAHFYGDRLCAPCRYLERLVAPGLYDAIKGRGGLRADIVRTGRISVGDAIYRV